MVNDVIRRYMSGETICDVGIPDIKVSDEHSASFFNKSTDYVVFLRISSHEFSWP